MFTSPEEWQNAYDAADRALSLAVDQGYITYILPAHRKGIAQEVAKAVILSNVQEVPGDILDGEVEIDG